MTASPPAGSVGGGGDGQIEPRPAHGGGPILEPRPGVRLSIEDLVGSRVLGADGSQVGRVVDVEVTLGPPMRLTGLVVSGTGWLLRLRVAARLRRRMPEVRKVGVVPWEKVAGWSRDLVVLNTSSDQAIADETVT